MNCEKCGTKKATVFYKENLNGKIRALNLCAQCAEKLRQTGELEDFSSPFLNFLSPLISYREHAATSLPVTPGKSYGTAAQNKSCPACGQTLSGLLETGFAGCDTCYTTFRDELRSALFVQNGCGGYAGPIPRSYREQQEKKLLLDKLRQELTQAVREERFEQAAGIRDRIRGLEAGKEN